MSLVYAPNGCRLKFKKGEAGAVDHLVTGLVLRATKCRLSFSWCPLLIALGRVTRKFTFVKWWIPITSCVKISAPRFALHSPARLSVLDYPVFPFLFPFSVSFCWSCVWTTFFILRLNAKAGHLPSFLKKKQPSSPSELWIRVADAAKEKENTRGNKKAGARKYSNHVYDVKNRSGMGPTREFGQLI
jgi:hypothetical protein